MTVPPDAMAPVKVPANLPELVRTAFNRARASGDVHFFPTQVALVSVNSVPFQLRFSPALANKPRAPQPPAPSPNLPPPSLSTEGTTDKQQEKESGKRGNGGGKDKEEGQQKTFFDPFHNPAEAMLVAPLPPSHNLVLNKFAIVPEHFILATQAFKEQTHLLERDDLEVAYACVEAYHRDRVGRDSKQSTSVAAVATGGEGSAKRRRVDVDGETDGEGKGDGDSGNEEGSELFVFFNSGPSSGSSQPHRHIQMLPVSRMREGLNEDEDRAWEVLAGTLIKDEVRGRVPFVTFAERIGKGVDLEQVYLRLYRNACEAVLGSEAAQADGEHKEARVDYNLAMTRDIMVIAPRVAEGTTVSAVGEDGQRKEVGKLALNGTVLAGTALVKLQAEWDALRAEPEQLLELLGRIGVPGVQALPLL